MRQRTIAAVAVATALVLGLAACGDDDDGDKKDAAEVKVLSVDGNTGQGFADNFAKDEGALVGLRGTVPQTELSQDFRDRLEDVAPDIKDVTYSGESFDAVTISALAAEIGRSTEGTEIAKYMNAVTVTGEKCSTFTDCKKLIDEDKDIDYEGVSGPLDFTDPGEPSIGSYGVFSYEKGEKDAYNKLSDKVEFQVAGDQEQATKETVEAPSRDTAASGGALKIGALLSQTGDLRTIGPPATAGAKLAIKEINEAGGVNGAPVEIEEADDGTDPNVAGPAADRLLQSDVDVVLGCLGSTVSLSVIDKITGAGKVMISPSNTSDKFTTYNDRGLYFRTAPPDKWQAKALSNIIVDDGADRIAILRQQTDYGEGLANNLKKDLVDAGVPEGDVLVIAYDAAGSDFSAEVDQAKNHDPEYVVVIGYEESKTIITKMNEVGIGPKR